MLVGHDNGMEGWFGDVLSWTPIGLAYRGAKAVVKAVKPKPAAPPPPPAETPAVASQKAASRGAAASAASKKAAQRRAQKQAEQAEQAVAVIPQQLTLAPPSPAQTYAPPVNPFAYTPKAPLPAWIIPVAVAGGAGLLWFLTRRSPQ